MVRIQRVQILSCRSLPLSTTVIFWMFGRHIRLVRFFAWLTLWPNEGILPQTSHFAIIKYTVLQPYENELFAKTS